MPSKSQPKMMAGARRTPKILNLFFMPKTVPVSELH
jgi:hypothetical protein